MLSSFSLQVQDSSGLWLSVAGNLTFTDQYTATVTRATKSLSITSDGNFTFADSGTGINSKGPVTISVAGVMTTIEGKIETTGTGSSGTISLTTTAGGITQTTDGTITAATLEIDSAGAINLDGSSHAVDTLLVTKSAGVNFKNDKPLIIDGIASAATVEVEAGGAITINDKITITGTGDISLEAGGAIAINDKIETTGTGKVTVTATGGITQTTDGTITAATLEIDSGGAIDLDGSAHAVDNLAVTAAGGPVDFKNSQALVITGMLLLGAHSLTLETTTGAITTNAALAAETVSLTASGDVAVNDAVTGTAGVTINAGGTLNAVAGISSTNALITLIADSMTVGGATNPLNAGTGTVAIKNKTALRTIALGGGAAISIGTTITAGVLEVGSRSVPASGAVTVSGNYASIPSIIVKTGDAVSDNSVLQGNVVTIDAAGLVALDGSAHKINALTVTGSAGVKFRNDQALAINGITSSAAVDVEAAGAITISGAIANTGIGPAGNVNLRTTADGISQTGTGVISGTALTVQTAGLAVLDAPANSVAALSVTGSAGVNFTNGQDLTISGITSSAAVVVEAAGAITVSGAVGAGANPVTIQGTGIDVPGAISGTTLYLTATTGGISGSGILTGGTLTINATGAVDLDNSAHGVAALDVVTSAGIEFKNTGAVGIARINSVGAVAVEAGGAITINGPIDAGANTVTILGTALSGTGAINGTALSLTATTGGISGNGVLTGTSLAINAAGPVDLDNSAHVVDTLSVTGSAGVAFTNNQALTISGIASSAAVAVEAGGALTISGPIANTGTGPAGNVNLRTTADGISQTAGNAITGTTLTAQAVGPVNLVETTNAVTALYVTDGAGVTFTNSQALTIDGITSSAAVAVDAAGAITVSGAVGAGANPVTIQGTGIDVLGAISGTTLYLTATTGGISGTGVITGTTLTIDAAAAVDLDGSSHGVAALDVATSAGMEFKNTGALDIIKINSVGAVAVEAGGALTISGPLANTGIGPAGTVSLRTNADGISQTGTGAISGTALTVHSAGLADLGAPVNRVDTLLVTESGGINFTNSQALTISGITSSAAVEVDAAGALTISGPIENTGTGSLGAVSLTTTDGLSQTTSAPITAVDLRVIAAGDVLLDGADNLAANLAVTGPGGGPLNGDVRFRKGSGRTLTIGSGGSGILVGTGKTVTLETQGGAIAQSAPLTADGLRLLGTNGGSIVLDHAGNAVPAFAADLSGSGSVTLRNSHSAGLTIGTVAGTVGIAASGQTLAITQTAGPLTLNQPLDLGSTGDAALNAAGGIAQVATAAVLSARTLTLGSTGGAITLNSNNAVANLLILGAGGPVQFVNARSLAVGIAGAAGSGIVSGNNAVTITTPVAGDGAITVEQALNAGTGGITLRTVDGLTLNADLIGSRVVLDNGNAGGITQTAGSITATTLLDIQGRYRDPLELRRPNHVAAIRAADAGVAIAFVNELPAAETLTIDAANGGGHAVSITETGGSIAVAGSISAAKLTLAAKADISLGGTASFQQPDPAGGGRPPDEIVFSLGRTLANANPLRAGNAIGIRPFDPAQAVYVSMPGLSPNDLSIPQSTFDSFNAPLVVVGGRDEQGALYARGDLHIGSFTNGSSGGYDSEMSSAATLYVEGAMTLTGAAVPERTAKLIAERLVMRPQAGIVPDAAAGSAIRVTLEINRLEAAPDSRIAADLIELYPRGAAASHAARDLDIQYGDADIPGIMPKRGSAPVPYVYYSSLWEVVHAGRYILGHENYNGDIYISGVGGATYELEAVNSGNSGEDYSVYFFGAYRSNGKPLKLRSKEVALLNTAHIDVGAAEELTIDRELKLRFSGVSPDNLTTAITGGGIVRIAGGIEGRDGVSFAIVTTGADAAKSSAVLAGPVAMDGDFSYAGALLAVGAAGSGGVPIGFAAAGISLDAPLVAGDIAFDGDLAFAPQRSVGEFTGHIVNKKRIRAGAAQQVLFSGKYTGMSGSVLAGTEESTEIHFRNDAEFLGVPAAGYEDKGSWLVFSGPEIQEFNAGGVLLGKVLLDKGGGELRIAANDVVQRGDAVLRFKEGLLNLTHGTDRRNWTLGVSGPAAPAGGGHFTGRGGTLALDNNSGTGAELRAMDLTLQEQCSLVAGSAGNNVLAAMGSIAIAGTNKDFGTARVVLIPGSAAERTQLASEAALHTLVALRPAKLVGDITLTDMQLGSPSYAQLNSPPAAYVGGISLDGGSSVIRVLGNWTNHVVDTDSDGVSRAFVYGTSSVIFDRASNPDKAIAIRGGSAWHAFVCESPGAVIGFDNYPSRHYVERSFTVKGSSVEGGHIVLTRLSDEGLPDRRPPDTVLPLLPLTEQDHRKYWDFVRPSAADGSGGTKLEIENVIITYSNANLRAPLPPREKNVLAYPFYSRDNPSPPAVHPGGESGRYSYYNINWVVAYSFVYAFTEDSDGNGKIDRIRAQAAYELNTGESGAFDKLSVTVTKQGETEAWLKVTGYGRVTGSADSLYIYLEEHDYADGGAKGLAVEIEANESLVDLATGLSPVANPGDGPLLTTDTVFPRVSYALLPPRSDKAFVQFTEAVDGPAEFVYPNNQAPAAVAAVGSAGSEFELTLGTGYAVEDLAAGSLFTVAGITDRAAWARDKNEDDPDYPPPKYPVDWKYSDYVVVPGNPPDLRRGYRIVPGDSASLSALTPPNALPGGVFSHRVTDLLISEYPDYAAIPVWAMNPQEGVDAAQGAHAVRVFDGVDYLEDEDITLEVNVHPSLAGHTPELLFVSEIPDAYRVGSSPVDPDFGVPHGITGLWLPGFASRGYDPGPPPRENTYAFSNIVPRPYLPASVLDKPDPASGGNFDFKLKKNAAAYTYTGGSVLEFYLRLIPERENPASDDLYIARLGKGSPWYRHIEPFKFGIHNIARQRGGVTILNNVINPWRGERVYVDYVLPRSGPVVVQVFTLDGNLIKTLVRETKAAGEYRVGWDGRNNGGREVARGMYFIRVVAPEVDEIRKALVVR
jgi:hypothetical protein